MRSRLGRAASWPKALIVLVAAGGVLMGLQSSFFIARIGWEAYLTTLMLLAVGLAALARPPRR